MKQYPLHYRQSAIVSARPEEVFAYINDHKQFSSHMNQSSWMMGGGKMETQTDADQGQAIGSHITMAGRVFGVRLFLDEVVTTYNPPHAKAWETTGSIRLLIIGNYKMGFTIEPDPAGCRLTVYIDYELPNGTFTRILGILLASFYAKWCVRQMLEGTARHWHS